MPRDTDPRLQRRAIASLAHATAHEVCALREADGLIEHCINVGEARMVLYDLINQRQQKVALMAGQVVGHA